MTSQLTASSNLRPMSPSNQPKSLQPLWNACLELREGEKKETTQTEEDGASKKDELHKFGRRFEFSFIIRAFFSRLLVRLLRVGVWKSDTPKKEGEGRERGGRSRE